MPASHHVPRNVQSSASAGRRSTCDLSLTDFLPFLFLVSRILFHSPISEAIPISIPISFSYSILKLLLTNMPEPAFISGADGQEVFQAQVCFSLSKDLR